MEKLPNYLKIPTNENHISIEVLQRGNINSEARSIERVIVPGSIKNFDLYRAVAYQCKKIPNCIYRENVEIKIKNRPRPIRIDALLIMGEQIYLIDTVLKDADIPKSRRYCNDIVHDCHQITNILLLISEKIKDNIDTAKWAKPVHKITITT